MKSFCEARDFMINKSPLDIFYEILPYIMYAEQKGKSFGHDRIAILVAAFGGSFNEAVFEYPAIKDLLQMSNWGWEDHGTAIQRWGDKYARTPEEKLHFNSICNNLKQKSDDVYNYLQENARTGFAFKSGWQFK